MQNFAPFWISVTSRFINGFFRKNSHPLSDTKVDHFSDIEKNYWLGNQIAFMKHISDNRDPRPKLLFTEISPEINANSPECKKLRKCCAGRVFLFVPPK